MPTPSSCSIAILTSHDPANFALINALQETYPIKLIVFESQAYGRFKRLWRRLRKLGFTTVLDQMAFKVLDLLLFRRQAKLRAEELLGREIIFQGANFPHTLVKKTASINSSEVASILRATEPDVVVVSGTSILDGKLLASLGSTPVINIHCGITPRYRGAHGAFWAVVKGDWTNVGTTVHFVDSGIDTGGIILQASIDLEPDDNPRTIGLKQYAVGIRLLSEAISRTCAGDRNTTQRDDLDSRVYSSPTFTGYLRFRKRMKERFSGRHSS